ncbi:hypothetical protein [Wolbachia endosymbiont of Folsomia candida]|uniref:hypothetical protein n=1 Tax=Wolbachia endosymbiont of Folsomia candida TaxID=169402 RepID=UPI000A67CF86|nr:hypothetical protein [Wolbachia endosymbiont of Folsomia candida]APR98220.1 hypothetical protein ASM33_02840 [Wolbachia endosymbiont of Folsomia candida]
MKQETKERLKEYSIYYGKRIPTGLIMGSAIGLGLSCLPLSPLLMGAIIAAVPIILFTAYEYYKESKAFDKMMQEHPNVNPEAVKLANDLFIKDALKGLLKDVLTMCVIAAACVGFAAGICALIPGAMVVMAPAALTGAAIGTIAVVAKDPVKQRIISPIVAKINECCSSVGCQAA